MVINYHSARNPDVLSPVGIAPRELIMLRAFSASDNGRRIRSGGARPALSTTKAQRPKSRGFALRSPMTRLTPPSRCAAPMAYAKPRGTAAFARLQEDVGRLRVAPDGGRVTSALGSADIAIFGTLVRRSEVVRPFSAFSRETLRASSAPLGCSPAQLGRGALDAGA